jgi:hypothetical protein
MPRDRATAQCKYCCTCNSRFSILDLVAASYSHFCIGIFRVVIIMDPTTEPTALPAFLALPTHLRQPFLNAVGKNPLN